MHKKNLFFYDSKKYDNSSLRFIGTMIYPTTYSFDYFSLKNKMRVYTNKPKFMSFKLFLENQMSRFEKFYIKNELYIADSLDYEQLYQENYNDFSFFYSPENKFVEQRQEDIYHFFRVRVPMENESTRDKLRARAKNLERDNIFSDDKKLVSEFILPESFFRRSKKEKIKKEN